MIMSKDTIDLLISTIDDVILSIDARKGGAGSGNFGHGGRPGRVGGSSDYMVGTARGADGELTLADGSPIPEHAAGVKPSWTNVMINTDPNAELIAKGLDAKGRTQYLYSDAHWNKVAAEKFARISELREKESKVAAEVTRDMSSDNYTVREAAVCLKLIHHTGIRPGGEEEKTKASVESHGATTLKGQHVMNDGALLQFTGKKGVNLSIPVTDKRLIEELKTRKREAGDNGNLFNIDSDTLRQYTSDKDGGGFTPKDFRTLKGTNEASRMVESMNKKGVKPRTMKEYKKAVKDVATHVSSILGNTPTVALQSYIDPNVFAEWRPM